MFKKAPLLLGQTVLKRLGKIEKAGKSTDDKSSTQKDLFIVERFVWKRHKDIFKGVGIYHITFVLSGRQPLLGSLVVDHDEPRCLPTDLGSAISHDLDEIQIRRPYVRLLAKQLMPDHIHVLLYVTDDCGISIKEIARGMRQGWRQFPASVSIAPQMVSAGEYKHMPEQGKPPMFEKPFFRTLAHKGQLDAMIQYIHDNQI